MINTRRMILMMVVFIIFLPVLAMAGTVDLPKTGQTTSYYPGDDGDIKVGISWPEPRFTDNGDGTVTDNLTGLMWLKDANCFGLTKWQNALDTIVDFNADPSTYSCQDYSASYTDWRIPNKKEFHSLTDFSQYNPSLPSGHPFANVQIDYRHDYYWSSTTYASNTSNAWIVDMWDGIIDNTNKTYINYVWPVRAGTVGALPVPDIKANGSDGPVTISQGDNLTVTVSLDPGSYGGEDADWWVAATSPFGLYWYTLDLGWVRSDTPIRVYGGPLFSLSPYTVLEMSTLPVGDYTFYFAVDDNMDDMLDATYLDSVLVTIQ